MWFYFNAYAVTIPPGKYIGTLTGCPDNSISQYGLIFTSDNLINSITGESNFSPITFALYNAYSNNTIVIGNFGCSAYSLNGDELKVYFQITLENDCSKVVNTCSNTTEAILANLKFDPTYHGNTPGSSSTLLPFASLIGILFIISTLF